MQYHAPACVRGNLRQLISYQRISDTRSTYRRSTALILVLLLAFITSARLFAQQQSYPPPPPDETYNQDAPAQQYSEPAPQSGTYGYPPQPSAPQYGYNQQQGLSPDQLEQLVAPIALDPDPIVALVLAASTYPQQVQQADQWRQAQGNAAPEQIVYGADQQNWDPSVKALTAFPQVLAEMDQNIQWTYALGNAYYNQPQDILQAIQIMRQRAQAAGNLQSSPQESVSYDQGNIQLMPANPQVVYVPSYNPWTVYGDPVTPYPGFSLLGAIGSFFNSSFGSSAIQYGLGIVLSAFDHTPWGLLSWGLDWLGEHLLFNHSDYYCNSPYVSDWGLPYGGPRARFAPHRLYAGYGWNRDRGWYGRSGYNGRYNNSYNNGNNRYRENYNRGYRNQYANQYAQNRAGYGYRNSFSNRAQSPFARQASYSNYGRSYGNFSRGNFTRGNFTRPAYGSNLRYANQSGYRGRTGSPFANRSGYFGSRGNQSWRAPSASFNRSGYDQRSYNYRGNAFAGSNKSSHSSGGFHMFGGSHNSGFGHESYKAPHYKAPHYKASHSFGGGHHSFGGGHHSFGGGGHHSSGGGHHSGGHHH